MNYISPSLFAHKSLLSVNRFASN